MAYKHTNSKGVTYYLHKTEVTLRGGKPQTIYFFAKVEKNAKERGAKRGFKGSATVQKPGGYHADNKGCKPPILYLEEIAQCQAKRERKNDSEQRRNSPREPDGAFKWCHQGLQPDRET